MLHLWRDIERFSRELTEFAPEDSKAIRRLRRHVETIGVYMPSSTGFADLIKRLLWLPLFIPRLISLFCTSTHRYVERFKNPYIKE